jgi:hypothetical protein
MATIIQVHHQQLVWHINRWVSSNKLVEQLVNAQLLLIEPIEAWQPQPLRLIAERTAARMHGVVISYDTGEPREPSTVDERI